MYFAYIDDSGDPGQRGSFSYSLGCVLVHADSWNATLDGLIAYRRRLRDLHGVPVRQELKANWVIRGSGPLRALGLSVDVRRRIYRGHFRIQPRLGIKTFGVVINKGRHFALPMPGPVERRAWEYTLQRLERFSDDKQASMFIIHDEGSDAMVTAMARKWRRAGSAGMRYQPGGRLDRPFVRLVDDAVARNSRQSYMLQLADFAAYGAFRKVYPPRGDANADPDRIAVAETWDLLGDARHTAVTSDRSDGIVSW